MQWAARAFLGLEAAYESQTPGAEDAVREVVPAWVLSGVAVEGHVGSAVVVAVAAEASSAVVVVQLQHAHLGCGREVVAAKVVAAWGTGCRRGTQVVVYSREGAVVAEPAVVSRARRQRVCWPSAWWQVRGGVVWG